MTMPQMTLDFLTGAPDEGEVKLNAIVGIY